MKNNSAEFRPDPTWNNGALGFFEEVAPNKKKKKSNNKKMTRAMKSVPDPKIVLNDKNTLSAAEMLGTWPSFVGRLLGRVLGER